jgi:hypothetical protein
MQEATIEFLNDDTDSGETTERDVGTIVDNCGFESTKEDMGVCLECAMPTSFGQAFLRMASEGYKNIINIMQEMRKSKLFDLHTNKNHSLARTVHQTTIGQTKLP